MHLSAANVGLPSSGISVQMLAASAIVPDVNTAVVAGSDGVGDALGRLSPTAAMQAASLASLPSQVPLLWDWEQLHEFAECLKQLKINTLGKK